MKRLILALAVLLVASVAFGEITVGGKAPAKKPANLGAFGGGINKYHPDSLANPYGAGSRYKSDGLMNPYSRYGSRYSNESWRNPYATEAPRLYQGGRYLGKLTTNPHDADSINNKFGRYGSKYSPDSVRNPYGPGSRYSNQPVYVRPR